MCVFAALLGAFSGVVVWVFLKAVIICTALVWEKLPEITGSAQNRVYIKDLERRTREALGRKVRITKNEKKKSIELFYQDDDDEKYPDPPKLEVKIVNPFICHQSSDKDADARGFLPETPEFFRAKNELKGNGGVIFDYAFYFKSVVERGNTGSELSNNALITGAATLGFNREKVLAIYEKENEVEQTIGFPILCRIPILKYLFSTVTTIKERTYIIVTAEAEMIHPDDAETRPVSVGVDIDRRPEKVFLHPNKKRTQEAQADGGKADETKADAKPAAEAEAAAKPTAEPVKK